MANDRSKTLPEFLSDHEVTNPQANDVLIIEDVPVSGNSITGGVRVSTLLSNSSSNVYVKDGYSLSSNALYVRTASTPVTSSDTVEKGKIWWDADYIYVAVANNIIKRAVLTTF